ncbi:hypothetical protein MCANUF31_00833 [Mycoplasmopsis canis UF31]|uniref:TMEM164 family acyltransferase n=1 Tax=Mycoplasmopsis canis TaxID=29555 RepID=UPI00025AEC62|nr:YwaF family protein [Mycoplasmopsis canis]EIE40374.1 hypothetical protein MCANUF31_00833 [Mycoplasmopsis canis UF31]WQQ12530.1 YwaF family protein [Mycoplasmopsis canis]
MGFLHYRRNIVDFESSKGIFYIFFGIAIFIVLIMFIYRKKIHTYFNESQRRFIFNLLSLEELLMLIGFIALFFNFLRLFFLIFIDFPFKSELIPLHLCRFFTFLIPVLFIFRKGYKINLFSPIAIIGAVLGFLFVNLGVIPEVIADDIKYHDLVPGTKEYELAGYNVGYDGVMFWDFILAHSFVFIIPVFTHIIYGEKAKITTSVFLRGAMYLLTLLCIVVILNVILYFVTKNLDDKTKIEWNSNWFYLGSTGISTLGKFSMWPLSPLIFSIAGIFVYILLYILYITLTCVEFEINKYLMITKVRIKNIKQNFNSLKEPLFKVKK